VKDDEQKPMTQEERDALPPLPAEELARIQVEMALRDEVERLN